MKKIVTRGTCAISEFVSQKAPRVHKIQIQNECVKREFSVENYHTLHTCCDCGS